MIEMMKAVRLHEFGGPEVLSYEEAPRPVAASGEVLVRVHAAGINPPDLYLRDGYRTLPPEWQPEPTFPLILGTDVSGVVAAIGDGVSAFSVGDEVFAMVRFPEDLMQGSGAYAEYVTVPASELALKPAGIDHIQAAGALMSLLTAWQFLVDLGHDAPNPFQSFRHSPIPLQGKTVLVNGAGGGVGHLAIQLAKWRGAHVIAVASGKHEALLRALGADQIIDYTKTAAETAAEDVDLVIDAVGGSNMERFLNVVRPGGALFLVNRGLLGAQGCCPVWDNRVIDAGSLKRCTTCRSGSPAQRRFHSRRDRQHLPVGGGCGCPRTSFRRWYPGQNRSFAG